MRLLAFTAKKQTGKTTAVTYLRSKMTNSVQINFKDALVEELITLFPELIAEIGKTYDNNPKWYDGKTWDAERLFKEKPPLIRSLMRNFGTEVRRKQDPEYWVKEWQRKIDQNFVADVFVDDVRFLNEAEAVKRNGGMIIKIISDRPSPDDAHQSESEMDLIVPDRVIKNFFEEPEVMYKQLDSLL